MRAGGVRALSGGRRAGWRRRRKRTSVPRNLPSDATGHASRWASKLKIGGAPRENRLQSVTCSTSVGSNGGEGLDCRRWPNSGTANIFDRNDCCKDWTCSYLPPRAAQVSLVPLASLFALADTLPTPYRSDAREPASIRMPLFFSDRASSFASWLSMLSN